jgi:hypothetical protein
MTFKNKMSAKWAKNQVFKRWLIWFLNKHKYGVNFERDNFICFFLNDCAVYIAKGRWHWVSHGEKIPRILHWGHAMDHEKFVKISHHLTSEIGHGSNCSWVNWHDWWKANSRWPPTWMSGGHQKAPSLAINGHLPTYKTYGKYQNKTSSLSQVIDQTSFTTFFLKSAPYRTEKSIKSKTRTTCCVSSLVKPTIKIWWRYNHYWWSKAQFSVFTKHPLVAKPWIESCPSSKGNKLCPHAIHTSSINLFSRYWCDAIHYMIFIKRPL